MSFEGLVLVPSVLNICQEMNKRFQSLGLSLYLELFFIRFHHSPITVLLQLDVFI